MSSTLYKKRIRTEAEKLRIFTSADIMQQVNNYPNMSGVGRTAYQITIFQVNSLFRTIPNIQIKVPGTKKIPHVWEWISDEK